MSRPAVGVRFTPFTTRPVDRSYDSVDSYGAADGGFRPEKLITVEAATSRPEIAKALGSTYTQWEIYGSVTTPDTQVVGCVTTPVSWWFPEMQPTVDRRTVALMTAAAERIAGAALEARAGESQFSFWVADNQQTTAREARETTKSVGSGRTFIGWHADELVTCFIVCVSRPHLSGRSPDQRACDASVVQARLEGSDSPPRAGAVVSGLSWALNHPSNALGWLSMASLAVASMAVGLRRRPRSRI